METIALSPPQVTDQSTLATRLPSQRDRGAASLCLQRELSGSSESLAVADAVW
jgi:hypothetical protein